MLFGPDPSAPERNGGVAAHMRYLDKAFTHAETPHKEFYYDWAALGRVLPTGLERIAAALRCSFELRTADSCAGDVAHINATLSAKGAFRLSPIIAACKQKNVPIVLQVHGGRLDRLRGNPVAWRVWQWTLEAADVIGVFPGPQWDSFVRAGWGHKLCATRNLVARTQDVDRSHQHEPVFLFLGRLEESKGVGELLDAFLALQETGVSSARLILAGSGPMSSALAERIRKQAPNGSVRLAGFLSGNGLRDVIEEANIFVLPSREEAFPLSFLETAEAGAAPIVTSNSAIPVYFEAERHFLPVQHGDKAQLITQMRRLATNQQQRTLMGSQVRDAVRSGFTVESASDAYVEMYKRAIGLHASR